LSPNLWGKRPVNIPALDGVQTDETE